ncbi:hypothetical protein ACQP1W_46165 [Spirillospora sp. CA-255316]
MVTRCCDSPELSPLMNLAERGVPHGSPGHNVNHDYTRVSRCGACAGGVVEHHSHDCWDPADHPSWDMYWWWRIDTADMGAMLEAAASCPAPLDSSCTCRVHEGLGGANVPPRQARSTETPYEKAPAPRAAVRVEGGAPRWAAG